MKLPTVVVKSNLNQRCKITSMYAFKKTYSPMPFFVMRKLCLWSSKHTLTKNNEGLNGIFFTGNIRLSNKHMGVDIFGQYLHFS